MIPGLIQLFVAIGAGVAVFALLGVLVWLGMREWRGSDDQPWHANAEPS